MSLGEAMYQVQQFEEAKLELKLEKQRVEARNAKVGDLWYRYDDKTYASSSEDEYEPVYYRTQIEITRFVVMRVTPKGVQLVGAGYGPRRPRLVLHESYKRFACATQELALESYLKRKAKQHAVYEGRAKLAKHCAFEARQGRVKFVNDPTKINLDPDKRFLSW